MTIEEMLLLEGLKQCKSQEQMALWLNNIQYIGGVSEECREEIRRILNGGEPYRQEGER